MLKKIVPSAALGLLFGCVAFAQPSLRPGTAGQSNGADPQANIGSTVTDPAMTPAPSSQRNPANMPADKVESGPGSEELSVDSQDSRIEATRKNKSQNDNGGQDTGTKDNSVSNAPGGNEWRQNRD
jgi:hypothetical protein